MGGFNNKSFEDSVYLTCKLCGRTSPFKTASKGCPVCRHHLLKVAKKGEFPRMDHVDKRKDDEYIQQARPSIGDKEHGYKLTTFGDEDEMSGSAGGTNQRDGYPEDYSAKDTKERKVNKNIPTDVSNIDPGEDQDGNTETPYRGANPSSKFVDPDDSTSVMNTMRDRQKFPNQSLNGMLEKSRMGSDQSNPPRLVDKNSVFHTVRNRLRGLRR